MQFPERLATPLALLLCAAFLCAGYAFIRHAGVHSEEAEFAAAVFAPYQAEDSLELAGRSIPLMTSPYAGGLKAAAYKLIFKLVPADVRTLRAPVLALAGLTILLWFLLLRRLLGAPRALFATALLAADPVFLLSSVYDWGPVALQHLLAVSALLLAVLFHQLGRYRFLALACLLTGVALWDKLTIVWVIAGVFAGAWAAWPQLLRRYCDRKLLAFVLLWTCIGAAPLLLYNLRSGGGSWHGSGGFGGPLAARTPLFYKTLDGSALFGWLVRAPGDGAPREPVTLIERTSVAVSGFAHMPESHVLGAACLASLALLAYLWRSPGRPALLFCLVAMGVGWAMMLPFSRGMNGVHHVILLWPLPHVLAVLTIWEVARLLRHQRGFVVAVLALAMLASSALLTNEYFARLVRWGPAPPWSDAIHALRARLAETPSGGMLAVDQDILPPLRLLGRGVLPLRLSPAWMTPGALDLRQTAAARAVLEAGSFHFLSYVSRTGRDDAALDHLRNLAARFGCRESVVADIPDRNGRPVFRISRFEPAPR
jgi:hypothetical protein